MSDLRRDKIIAEARARLGVAYRLDPPPDGVNNTDCSLYVRDVYEAAGLTWPAGVRTAEQERQATIPIEWADVLPGDLSIGRVGQQAHPSRAGDISGFLLVREPPKLNQPSVRPNGCPPLPSRLIPMHASVRRCRTRRPWSVLRVCGGGNRSQIRMAVVETITVDMIDKPIIIRLKPQQFSVHQDQAVIRSGPLAANGIASGIESPRPLARPLDISDANDHIRTHGSVTCVERDHRGRVVVDEFDRSGWDSVGACTRTETPSCFALAWPRQEQRGACLARRERRGTLPGHRTYLRCQPPVVSATRGHLHGEFYHV